ncbi:hypothetical protein N1851_019262 [Merluccius polli]|uniref:Uncharacterized protein n=1 Tax=Merluccius polli TaxID=89951 RepID=A0AA47MMK4_MERPO|nr:hypothetical protein N1851_019262 [Merluccius polli]
MRLRMRFHFSIAHVPGKSLATANVLSPVAPSRTPEDNAEKQQVEGYINSVLTSLPITEECLTELRQAQQADELLRQVVQYCLQDNALKT